MNQGRRLRGAVFGCGMISEFHLRGWQRIPEVEIVALGNRTKSRAENRREEFVPSARIYDDLSDLLRNEDLDFLDVLTPPDMHKEHCLKALDSGLNVICQKPIAPNVEDARKMIDAAGRVDRTLSIHENHRYRPWFREILKRAKTGFFGSLCYARFEQFDPKEPSEAYKVNSERGILLEYGTHLVDMIHALFGIPTSVMATGHKLNPRVHGESFVHLMLTYSGATACVDIGWKPTGLPQGTVLVVGDQGEAIYEGTMTRAQSSRFRLIENGRVIVNESRSPQHDYVESFYSFQRDVVDAWQRQSSIPQPAGDNLAVLETTLAAYEAIDNNRPTMLRP